MNVKGLIMVLSAAALCGCARKEVPRTMVVIAPGHYHAALIQKNSLEGVSDTVKVYAPEGPELDSYLATVESFNTREDHPTVWVEEVRAGDDYLSDVPQAGKGDFVVLAGNNERKAGDILHAVRKGYHVLSDKPMAVNRADYELLKTAYAEAGRKGLVIYDLMTERYDVLNRIVRRILSDKDFFGEFDGGVSISSVHHFYKLVAGSVLKRPAWYYDVRQQGEGIADVTTHLIDLVFWQCFPDEAIESRDVKLLDASHAPTPINPEQYKASTGTDPFPGYLSDAVRDGVLQVMSNGTMTFEVKGIPASIRVRWDFEAPEGSGDTSESLFEGTRATVRIIQDASTGFRRLLLVTAPEEAAKTMERKLKEEYASVSFEPYAAGTWLVDVPAEEKKSHEDHFNMVAKAFLNGLRTGEIPDWERVNTLTKYDLTTSAVALANEK